TTRYCLPPVLKTANILLPHSCRASSQGSMLGSLRPDRVLRPVLLTSSADDRRGAARMVASSAPTGAGITGRELPVQKRKAHPIQGKRAWAGQTAGLPTPN